MKIVCANCLTTNKIPENKNHQQASCGKCQKSVYSMAPLNLNDNQFYPFIERNELPVIVDFWASWCGPCKTMGPIFANVAKQSPTVLFAKVNTEAAQKIAADANIRSIPTLIFFHKGQEINRISGGLNEFQLKQWIMQSIKLL